MRRDAELLEVVAAGHAVGRLADLLDRRQQQPDQHRDNEIGRASCRERVIAAVIAYYVHQVNIQTACLIMEGAEFTESIIDGVERPVKAAELFAFTLRVRAGNTDVLTDAEENVRQKLRAEGVM